MLGKLLVAAAMTKPGQEILIELYKQVRFHFTSPSTHIRNAVLEQRKIRKDYNR